MTILSRNICFLLGFLLVNASAQAGPVIDLPHPCSGTGCTREDIKTDLWQIYPEANLAVSAMAAYQPSRREQACDFLSSFSSDLSHLSKEILGAAPDQKDATADDLAKQLGTLSSDLMGFCSAPAADGGRPAVAYGDVNAAKGKVGAIHRALDAIWPHFFKEL